MKTFIEILLANCKAKRIDERRLHYAIEGIEFKITEEKIFETTEVSDLNRDYTSEFLKKSSEVLWREYQNLRT